MWNLRITVKYRNYFSYVYNKIMKYTFLSLSIFLILSTIARADIEIAKGQCADLGFTPGTEKYADCVMKLLPKEESKKTKSNTDKASSEKIKKLKKKLPIL